MSLLNGNPPPRKPVAALFWDPVTQTVEFSVDPAEVKTWEFGKALLHMALDYAERTQKLAMLQQMEQAQRDQALARQIVNGRR